jgi:hypothetical protein
MITSEYTTTVSNMYIPVPFPTDRALNNNGDDFTTRKPAVQIQKQTTWTKEGRLSIYLSDGDNGR